MLPSVISLINAGPSDETVRVSVCQQALYDYQRCAVESGVSAGVANLASQTHRKAGAVHATSENRERRIMAW